MEIDVSPPAARHDRANMVLHGNSVSPSVKLSGDANSTYFAGDVRMKYSAQGNNKYYSYSIAAGGSHCVIDPRPRYLGLKSPKDSSDWRMSLKIRNLLEFGPISLAMGRSHVAQTWPSRPTVWLAGGGWWGDCQETGRVSLQWHASLQSTLREF